VSTAGELARLVPGSVLRGDAGVPVSGITRDSREVAAGTAFVAVRGATVDGHRFAAEAAARGAPLVVAEIDLDVDVAVLVVPDARAALGPLSCRVYGDPSKALRVIGVTGTNGKTTVTHLVGAVFEQAGESTRVLGTLSGARTTPEAPELQAQLADFRRRAVRVVAMEVSSHALALGRVAGTRFAAAVFTNLGRDHLDFHGTVEAYFAAKARLFDADHTELAVVNLDDAHGRRLADAPAVPTRGYRLADAAGLRIEGITSRFTWQGHEVVLRLPGAHNVANALAAATVADSLGVAADVVADALSGARTVPGRFELIDLGQPFRVAVDYAHTPDALEAALTAARSAADGRVVVVFGCGGDRDRDKRPAMGRVAEDGADVVIVTADNPRGEEPSAIETGILSGMRTPDAALLEPDRRAAIARSFDLARPGDLVLIAGKGHEAYQVIGDQVTEFDDRAVAAELLAERSR
jgi:UDP-N-acetylmuramoyl-L-alanyl-D-glutamate--2,6-diaminopimelate ligase